MNRYQQARERAGLSPVQAARIIGVSLPALAAIERGEAPLPVPHADLAETYGVTPCWLAGHETSPDLTELAREAEEKGVSVNDWTEIATMVQSRATCAACKANQS